MNCSCDAVRKRASATRSNRIDPLRSQTIAIGLAILSWICLSPQITAQTITSVQPRSCKPGQTTQLTIRGTDLNDSLRIASADKSVDWHVEKIEPTQATVAIRLRSDVSFGPLALWLTTATGDIKRHTLFVDDLDAVIDTGNNHSIETAQIVSTRCTIEGLCDASVSDFYRIHATVGERIAVEVHTQQLRSPMDPVLRLLDTQGETLVAVDDTSVGPDCRFSYQVADEGDYWLEIHDSRNSAAGSPYQLRIGDFPIVDHGYPLAVRSGEKTLIGFAGADGKQVAAREIQVPAQTRGAVTVPARFEDGESSSWVEIYSSPHPQFNESTAKNGLTLPIGISGRLDDPREVDNYVVHGTKGQVIRVAAKTRSLGSPTLLQMQLFNPAGAKIAETKVSDADQWSFDATLPEDGDYRLEVTDLLKRGGEEFGYLIEIAPSGTFAVALKADAATAEQFMIEPTHGACAINLQISRFGYDGEIELALTNTQSGLRILNPRIPSKATDARIFVAAHSDWKPDSLDVLQIVAKSVDQPEQSCLVNSHALRRVKEPFVINPTSQSNGAIALAAAARTDPPFEMEPAASIQLARPLRSHHATLTLKRIQDKFKAGVELLPNSLPAGWSVNAKADKETYKLTLARSDAATAEPEHLSLMVFGEFNGHGRIETYDLPVHWIDPIHITLKTSEPFVRGGRANIELQVVREGNDPQPVTIAISDLQAGITAPESIAVAADQTHADFQLQIDADIAVDTSGELTINASSQFAGQDFTVSSR